MSERASSKSPDEPDDGEDETIDVGTTVLAHLLTSDTGGDQIIDSSGSSEDSCLRDMSISQSFPLDTAHQRDADRHADVEPEGINQRTSSPKPLQELGSPEPEDLVSSPTDASTPNYDSYQSRKSMTCSLCDYSTTDRSNFKRHKRLHIRSNPVSVIKCEKCVYTTILPRKIREHYRQQHNMIYTCRQPDGLDASTSLYSGQQPLESSLTYQNLEMTSRQPPGNRSVSMAPSALHTLLTAVGPGRLEYGRLQNPGLAHYERYESQPIQRVQEPHMASNYLRSIVSTVMPPNPLHRAAATSTITSSSYYLNSGSAANHRHLASSTLQNPSLAGMQAMDLQLEQGVKVKQEPVDMVMDTVSSSGVGSRSPEPVRQFDPQPVPRVRHMEPPDSIYGLTSDRGGDAPSTSFSAQLSGSDDRRRDSRRESRHYEEASGSQAPIKTEVNSIGVQCAMSVVKTEPVDRPSDSSRRGVRSTLMMTERGTQCELIQCSTAQSTTSQSYGSDSEASDHQPQKPFSKCLHCSVTFEDEVLYSIHIGCHSHTDPYTCNVCGKQCHNKYGFYSHIMRGHQC